MRASFPDAHITIVCSQYNRIVMDGNDDVNAVQALPAAETPEAFGRTLGQFDLALALAPRALDMRLVAATGTPRRIGYTYARRFLTRLVARRWLTDVLVSEADPARCEQHPTMVVRHEVEQVLALAERAGARTVVRDLRITITETDRSAVADLPPDPIVIHLGQRWSERGSTTASLVALLHDLRTLGRPLVATHGDDAPDVVRAVRAVNAVDRIVGNLRFGTWAAVFERAACVVTIDTGATHVASAVHRPTVVLFEHAFFRLNSQEWSPYRVPNALIRKPSSEEPDALRASRGEIVAAVARLL